MPYCVYILECSNKSTYTGLTTNLKRRIAEHQNGLSVCTKNIRPVKLIFCCYFARKNLATRFEQYLKSHSGRIFAKKHLINKQACLA